MKGWKETYSNIVLSEQPNQRKLLKVARDLDKAIDKTGDLIKQIPEEMEMINGDYSEAYQELNSGQNSLEYGIRHLEGDIRDYFKEEVKEEIIERLGFHGKSPAELKGSEFDRKKEINNCKKLLKMLEQADKFHSKFQYNNRAAFGPNKIGEGLRKTEDAIYDYMNSIEKGKWDGKVTLED